MHARRSWSIAGAAALAAVVLTAGFEGLAADAQRFDTATVHFEQNATDRDYEVVFRIKGGKEGLAELTIVAPNGRKVVAFSAPERVTLGMRQFAFESPEPQDFASLRAAYPEGEYLFRGKSFSGATLAGKATLSHRLPPPTTILSPRPEAQRVAAARQITWRAVAGVSAYMVELKNDVSSVAAKLPASATSFAVPEGFLTAGTKYKLAVGTVGGEGNISFVETSFATAITAR